MAPSELIRAAAANGVGVLSLTDHDTTAGCGEAMAAASLNNVELVAGIEMSSTYDGNEYHVLGYLLDLKADALANYEIKMRAHRLERVEEILARLRALGISVASEEVAVEGGTPTRLHIARAIIERGYAQDAREAFEMYLGTGCPAYVPAAKADARTAIELIHNAGGVASLAHPGDWTPESHIRLFVDWGLDAIEVIHPSHDERLTRYYDELADRFGILKSGGSDFHAPEEPGASALGRHNIPYAWYAELKGKADESWRQ